VEKIRLELKDSIGIQILMPNSIRDSIRMQTADSQVPTFNLVPLTLTLTQPSLSICPHIDYHWHSADLIFLPYRLPILEMEMKNVSVLVSQHCVIVYA